MNFLKQFASSDLGKTMLDAAQKTVEEKLKEMSTSSQAETAVVKEESKEEKFYPVFNADTEEECANSYRRLRQNAAKNGLPHWLFFPIDVLLRAELNIPYLEKILKLEYINDPNFLGLELNGENIAHRFHMYPVDYQEIFIKYLTAKQINALTPSGDTAMHRICCKNEVRGFLLLWSQGGDINVPNKNGDYPLDIAIKHEATDILKCCLLFGGGAKNTLEHYTRTAPSSCKPIVTRHYEHMRQMADKNVLLNKGNPAHLRCAKLTKSGDKCKITLAIDGGGMKGVLALQLLSEIENVCGEKFMKAVNFIGGTSTGSIVTLGLAKYKSIRKVLQAYFRLKNDVFVGSRPYSGDGLENALINEFGSLSLKEFGDSAQIDIAIPVARVDVSPPSLYLFRSYSLDSNTVTASPHINPKSEEGQWSAAKIVRSSCAAPSYFPPVDGKFMDGGLVANNPTLELLSDIQRLSFENPKCGEHRIMISIGTGALEKKVNKLEMIRPSNLSGIVNTVNQVLHLKDILIDQITASDGSNVDRARWMAEAMQIPYFRFTPNLAFPVAIDERDDIVLIDSMLAVKYDSLTMFNDMKIVESVI